MRVSTLTGKDVTIRRIIGKDMTALEIEVETCGTKQTFMIHFEHDDPIIRELPATVDPDLQETARNFDRIRKPIFIPQMTDVEEYEMKQLFLSDCEELCPNTSSL